MMCVGIENSLIVRLWVTDLVCNSQGVRYTISKLNCVNDYVIPFYARLCCTLGYGNIRETSKRSKLGNELINCFICHFSIFNRV
jgi:hypothetical protein